MINRVSVLAFVALFTAGIVSAETPKLLFDRSQIDALHQRIIQPKFAPIWKKILADAEAYCNPASPRYADPKNLYSFAKIKDREIQQRNDALRVHTVGRELTQRMEAIGFAYQLTGHTELGQHGAELLLATIKQYPVSNPLVATGFAGGRGDIMRGLAIGYDLLSDCLDDDQRRVVAAACADYLDSFIKEFNNPKAWWFKVHNYNGVNGGAAGCLALTMRDAYPDRVNTWVSECVKIIARWLDSGFDKEGAYFEGVSYSGYGLSNTILFADALRRSGKGNLFDHPTFSRLPEFYVMSLLPGERVYDARNDSPYAGLNAILLKLAEVNNSGLYKWLWENSGADDTFLRILWENDIHSINPVAAGIPIAKHFRGRGLCIWRTGWTSNDVMFSIEAGLYHPTTHNQGDKGHFTLYGLGYRWATDPGYANENGPEGRGQTLGHSCVLIDGKGQALSGAGLGTSGVITEYTNNSRYGYALADCSEAYNHNNAGKPGAIVKHARRHTFFVYPYKGAPAYAVVMDDILKDEHPHDYTWQMMFSDQMAVKMGDGRAVFEPVQKPDARLVVRIHSCSQSVLTTDTFRPVDYHATAKFPRFKVTTHDVNPRFIAVLLPLTSAIAEPDVQFELREGKRITTVKWSQHTDTLIWSDSDGSAKLVELP